jgi:hypothetical protein
MACTWSMGCPCNDCKGHNSHRSDYDVCRCNYHRFLTGDAKKDFEFHNEAICNLIKEIDVLNLEICTKGEQFVVDDTPPWLQSTPVSTYLNDLLYSKEHALIWHSKQAYICNSAIVEAEESWDKELSLEAIHAANRRFEDARTRYSVWKSQGVRG